MNADPAFLQPQTRTPAQFEVGSAVALIGHHKYGDGMEATVEGHTKAFVRIHFDRDYLWESHQEKSVLIQPKFLVPRRAERTPGGAVPRSGYVTEYDATDEEDSDGGDTDEEDADGNDWSVRGADRVGTFPDRWACVTDAEDGGAKEGTGDEEESFGVCGFRREADSLVRTRANGSETRGYVTDDATRDATDEEDADEEAAAGGESAAAADEEDVDSDNPSVQGADHVGISPQVPLASGMRDGHRWACVTDAEGSDATCDATDEEDADEEECMENDSNRFSIANYNGLFQSYQKKLEKCNEETRAAKRDASEANQRCTALAITADHLRNLRDQAAARNSKLELENRDLRDRVRCVTCKQVTERGNEYSFMCGCKICGGCLMHKRPGDRCDGCGRVIKWRKTDTVSARVMGKLWFYSSWQI